MSSHSIHPTKPIRFIRNLPRPAPSVFVLLLSAGLTLGIYEVVTNGDPAYGWVATLMVAVMAMLGTALLLARSASRAAFWYGLSIGLMALSAINFELGPWPHRPWARGVPYLLSGFVSVGLAAYFDRNSHPTTAQWNNGRKTRVLAIRWPPLVLGVVALVIVADLSGQLLLTRLISPSIDSQFFLMVAGIALVAIGVWGSDDTPAGEGSDGREYDPVLLVALGMITVLGLVLRVWHLETAIHQFVDEMNFGRAVWGLRQADAGYVPLLSRFSSVAAFPWIYPYWQSLGIGVLGWNLTALRIVSALLGTMTIPALFMLAEVLFDRRMALVAALLLASFPPHLHFSRLGINNIADPLFGVLMLAFLTRGLKTGRQRDYALAGIMLGLTQYFYEGGRVVYPLLAVVWVEGLVVLRRICMNRDLTRRFGLFLLTGLIIAMPLFYTLLARGLPFLPRFGTAGVGGSYWTTLVDFEREQTLEEHILRPLLIYVRTPDLSEFYGGETPLLLLVVMPFFLLGLGYVLWRLRQPVYLLLLLWMGLVSGGGMLLAESGHAARFVVAFPAAVLLVTLGLWQVSLRRLWIFLALAAVLAVAQVDYYFNEHIPVYNGQRRQFLDFQDAVFRVTELPDGAQACFVTADPLDTILITNMRDYLNPALNVCQVAPDDLTTEYLDGMTAAPKAFFLDPDDETSPLVLAEYFAGRLAGPLLSPYDTVPLERQYHLYLAP